MKHAYKIINEYEKRKIDEFFAKEDVVKLLNDIKGVSDEEDHTFKGLAISTEHVDRMGEIVRQDGIDTDMYMKNPVILNSHNYYGIENIVGATTRLYKGEVDGVKATLADGRFAPTEAGKDAEALWKADCLHAASVGFIPEEFDKDDSRIITKSQLLEYSLVPVPANGWATRQETVKILAEKGITYESLRMKGFDIKREPTGEAEAGDECSMDDGTIGVFGHGNDGKLVCIPKGMPTPEKKTTEETGGKNDPSETSMWEELKSEVEFHHKAMKSHIQECVDCMKSEHGKDEEKEGEDADEKTARLLRIKAACEEHEKKLKLVMKAEHERHMKSVVKCYKAYTEKPDDDSDDQSGEHNQNDHDVDNEKAMRALLKDYTTTLVSKGSITEAEVDALIQMHLKSIDESTHAKLTALCEKFASGHDIHQKAIDEFKSLLAEREPSEGNDTEKSDPEKRSTPEGASEMSAEDIVTLARELNTATRDALTRFNHTKGRKS